MCNPSDLNDKPNNTNVVPIDEKAVSPLRRFSGMLCASFFTFTYVLAPTYILSVTVALLCRYPTPNKAFLYASPLFLSILSSPRPMPKVLGWFFSPMLDYFQFETIIEEEEELKKNLEQGKNYIFCNQPHGVLSLCGMCSSIGTDAKYRKMNSAVASSLLSFPILKNVMGMFNLIDASAKSLKKVLTENKGIEGCVVLYVGGIAELFKCSRDEEILHLSQRKGFIKLALRLGVDIVPVYLFGNTTVLSTVRNGFLEKLSRKTQMSFTIFWGKFFLPIPRDVKLLYVAGKALSIPKLAEPTQEDIDKYHKLYCQEITRLFETYKHKVPLYQNKTLIIE